MTAQATSTPALRAHARRNLVRLASLLSLTSIVIGVLSLFSVWSLNRAHARNEDRAAVVLRALDDGRSAQALFKLQVQEWKNVLLRGARTDAFAEHFAAFERSEADVRRRLDALTSEAQSIGMPDVGDRARTLLEEHRGLGQRYRQALDTARRGRWDPFAVDEQVRRIDRPLDAELDQLAARLVRDADAQREEAAAQEAARYTTLRRFLGWAVFASVALNALLVWLALRRDAV